MTNEGQGVKEEELDSVYSDDCMDEALEGSDAPDVTERTPSPPSTITTALEEPVSPVSKLAPIGDSSTAPAIQKESSAPASSSSASAIEVHRTADTPRNTSSTTPAAKIHRVVEAPSSKTVAEKAKLPPEDLATWAQRTESSLSQVRDLRNKLEHSKTLSEIQMAEPEKAAAAITSDHNAIRKAQDKLKKVKSRERGLASDFSTALEHALIDTFEVEHCVKELHRTASSTENALGVVKRRLEMRRKRPPPELIRDDLQDALEQERLALNESQELLAGQSAVGKTALAQLCAVVKEMHRIKLEFASDKKPITIEALGFTGNALSFLKFCEVLETETAKFCKSSNRAMVSIQAKVGLALGKTGACMKKRIAETHALKRALEVEIEQTKTALGDADITLTKMKKNLREALDMSEHSHGDSPDNQQFFPNSPTLEKVRGRIKGSAYVSNGSGNGGRRLDVIFSRFDTDRSGELDEVELRMAMRRVLRVAPTEITDAEIHLFFTLLDGDRSGCVSIAELVGFLQAQTDVNGLQVQVTSMENSKTQLKVVLEQLIEDHRAKTAAWRVDESLTKVDAARLGALDGGLDTTKTNGAATPMQRRRNAVAGRVLEAIRTKMKAAAYSVYAGRELDTLFSRFAKEKSGQLEDDEFRKAIRGALRIPSSVITDSDISSLCGVLDVDQSGYVRISEVVAFIGTDHLRPKPHAKAAQTPRRFPKPSESLNTSAGLEPMVFKQGPHEDASPRLLPDKPTRGPPLSQKTVEKVRAKMKAAAYTLQCTGTPSRHLEITFARFNKDHTGQLDDDEVRRAMRRILRIPPSVIADSEISSLCLLLDPDNTGSVAIKEIISFLGSEPGGVQLRETGKARSHDLPTPR